jgi:hypothetical protein
MGNFYSMEVDMNQYPLSFKITKFLFFSFWTISLYADWEAFTPDTASGYNQPMCALDDVNSTYKAYIRKQGRDPKKLLIFFDGGGSCWDPNTCIGSVLTENPLFTFNVDTLDELKKEGGVARSCEENQHNPFCDYTQVFIPYCTGDVFWGSNDTEYEYDTDGNGDVETYIIHHRGYDNFRAVLDWLSDNLTQMPEKVVVAGASAGGGYGAIGAFPAIKEVFSGSTKTYLLIDSSNGVINQDFFNRALAMDGKWGIKNLPDYLQVAITSSTPDTLFVNMLNELANNYPESRIGQYTAAWDVVQVGLLNIMSQIDDQTKWRDPKYLIPNFFEWTVRARSYMYQSASNPNYRFYLGAGAGHVMLNIDDLYTENSAQGVKLIDWINDMINKQSTDPWLRWKNNSDWRNVSCFPNCLKPVFEEL